jgi:glycosyltransferase involved in cell wall biosynthesis
VLDAAALGIPIITTASTGHGETLFPETTLAHEYDVDRACELGRRLLDDKDFYRAVAEYAQERITDYGVEKSVQRLLAVLP